MSRLLPGRPDVSPDDREPSMLALDDERADEVFDALGSETARTILQSLHADPRPASELTEDVGTTLQNVQYHLTKLEAADLVTVVDTWYGQNGAEMDVYAPTDEALVLFAGGDPESSLRALLERLVGVIAALAVGALAIVVLFDRFGLDQSRLVTSTGVNASEYQSAVEPVAPDPIVLVAVFLAGGLIVLSVLWVVDRIQSA
ncbi:ArsR/SmtB family transcription factor [Halorhabdus tiamatea]|uniref:Transcriptional regulator-like family, ArsR family protein n=2 Tax=Halorhabdus tiamatea SARL4B TaxID=1033806 RepID=F7PQA8_9EURY|nr:helix-turn-helix domain-containing protein [Halorhabdus tiamatea]CCQ33237.1 transcriptional regulator-like family, ArsR family protein [Halorhabdus tiamatea SARL4B]